MKTQMQLTNKIIKNLLVSGCPSGLPLEYIVDNLSLIINLNQPLLPFDNSNTTKSFQAYRQSRPRQKNQSFQ